MVVINGWRFTMKCLNSILLGLTITMLLPFDVKAISEDFCISGGIVGTLGGALVGYKLPGFIKECGLGEKLTFTAITAIPAGILTYAFLSRYTPHGRHKRAKKLFGNYLCNDTNINSILAQQNMEMTCNNRAKTLFEIRQKLIQGKKLLKSAIDGIKECKTKNEWKTTQYKVNIKINELAEKEKTTISDKSNLVQNDKTKASAELDKASAQKRFSQVAQWHVALNAIQWISSNTYVKGVLTGVLFAFAGKIGIKKACDYWSEKGSG